MRPYLVITGRIIMIALAGLVLAGPGTARADTTVIGDLDAVVTKGETDAAVAAIVLHPFTPAFGAFGFTLVTPEYAEAYVGPAFFAGPLRFGVGAGIEQHDPCFRVGLIASLELEPFSVLGSLETGGSGPYGALEAIWHPIEFLGGGLQMNAADGLGPRVELRTPWSFDIHAAYLLHPVDGHDTGIVGIRAVLE